MPDWPRRARSTGDASGRRSRDVTDAGGAPAVVDTRTRRESGGAVPDHPCRLEAAVSARPRARSLATAGFPTSRTPATTCTRRRRRPRWPAAEGRPARQLPARSTTRDSSAAAPPTRSRGAFEFDQLQAEADDFMPSRLFIYYNERVIEGTVDTDSGAQIRDGIKSVAKQGVLPETGGPTTSRSSRDKPPALLHGRRRSTRRSCYQRVAAGPGPAEGLPRRRLPVRLRLHRLRELRERRTWPRPASCRCRGRRAAARRPRGARRRLRRRAQRFIVRNSWGDGWGMQRLLHDALRLPHRAVLASDFWAILSVLRLRRGSAGPPCRRWGRGSSSARSSARMRAAWSRRWPAGRRSRCRRS